MLLRIVLILSCIIICYNFPAQYQGQYLELVNLRENCLRSLIFGVLISVISKEKVVDAIIAVELLLCICNFYIAYTWLDSGFLGEHYKSLQIGAYWLELIIMLLWVTFGANKRGDSGNFNNRNDLHSWVADHHSSPRN